MFCSYATTATLYRNNNRPLVILKIYRFSIFKCCGLLRFDDHSGLIMNIKNILDDYDGLRK